MFTIENGNRYLVQWDTGQRLIIDDREITEVHFAKGTNVAAVMQVTTEGDRRVVKIPNICLQLPNDLAVFFVITTPDGRSNTVHFSTIRVVRRPRPDDYVETEDEVLRWTTLASTIGSLTDLQTVEKTNLVAAINEVLKKVDTGGSIDPAAIAQAVEDYLSENPVQEKDPTVPAWAKETEKPSYTAQEVGADPSGTAAGLVAAHNTAEAAHNDIRLLISGLTDRLNALADSDDTTLDQMSELVAYIKSNKALIDSITTGKVSVADIVNDLTTNVANKPLSAAQGVKLKALIDDLQTALKQVTVEGAVLYNAAQPLTTEEQSQARENIGAQIADFVITMKAAEKNNLIPDKSWEEATEAYKAGRRLSCVYNSREYALDSFWEGEEAHFVHNSITDLTEQRIYFLLDGTAYWSTNKASTSTFPVASVNGQTGVVRLTAKDVDAISQDDLQEATNEALAQAKESGVFDGDDYVLTDDDKTEIAELAAELVEVPEAPEISMQPLTFTGAVEATYDGSKAVSVEIPRGGGGGESEWEIIRDITLVEEVVRNIIVTTKDNGEPFNYKKVACTVKVGDTALPGGWNNLAINPNPSHNNIWNGNPVVKRYFTPAAKKTYFFSYELMGDSVVHQYVAEEGGNVVMASDWRRGESITETAWVETYETEITGVSYQVNGTYPIGARFIFYGMK